MSIAAIGAFLYLKNTTLGRRTIDYIKLNLPVIGPMFNHLYITRAMRTMGTLITSGVPMLDMIIITRKVTNNIYYDELWEHINEKVQEGAQLSTAMYDSPMIPPSISRMIHSGEKAGRLGDVLQRIAEFTENELDDSIKQATQFIEPAMVVGMGGIIGFIAISLLLPIFSVGRVMSG